ncbi:MAG: thiamine pyrophosphate-dependent enzyme [Gemmatimonadota bacterium]
MLRTGMALGPAVAALRSSRTEADIVVTTMGAAREWMALGPLHPLDFVLVPSSMGQATSVGLGLALARPDRRVVVLNGDGSMLMNLGSLVTITAERPENLMVIVCDNGVYEVTGAQPTPGAPAGRRAADRVDFAMMARAAGFESIHRYSDLDRWTAELPTRLAETGPTFVLLDIAPDPTIGGPRSPGNAGERAKQFMAALAGSVSPGA